MATKTLPREIPLAVLENSSDPCYTVNESLEITYCNPAWDLFSRLNQGGPAALRASVLSRNLLDFIPEELKKYHTGLFATARALGRPVTHDYECSTATMFRLYRMQIYPLDTGFAVINSLRVEHPHDRTPVEPNDAIYRNSAGLIRMCSNCRRTNRADDPAAWDWVPAYLDYKGRKITHGVCLLCMEYFYRPYLMAREAGS